MHIAIVGAGAIGSFFGARLSQRGHRVTLVGRRDQVEAIQHQGLVLHDTRGRITRHRLEAATTLGERPDLVLLTVRTPDVAQACGDLQSRARGVPVVTMQNGVRADEQAAATLGRDAISGAVVMCEASNPQPGEVSVLFPGWIIVGEPFGAVRRRTRMIASVLSDAVPTYVTSHLERVRWSKLIATLSNGLCAATGLTLPEIVRTPVGRTLSVHVMREGYRVARAAGIRLDHGLYGLSARAMRHHPTTALLALLHSTFTTVVTMAPERVALAFAAAGWPTGRLPIRDPIWQSIARGTPSEIEYVNGEIVHLGWEYGVATPYNRHLIALVREVERSHVFRALDAVVPQPEAFTARPFTAAGAP